jgi:hypothetical protein
MIDGDKRFQGVRFPNDHDNNNNNNNNNKFKQKICKKKTSIDSIVTVSESRRRSKQLQNEHF